MITELQVQDALKKAIEKYGPRYVDPNSKIGVRCKNVYKDANGLISGRCIAAEALHTLGVSDGVLEEGNHAPIRVFGTKAELEIELSAMDLLEQAQIYQDNGTAWGNIGRTLGITE